MQLYRAFLVRCWRDSAATGEPQQGWRFALEEISRTPATTIGFANFELLVAFIANEIIADPLKDSGAQGSSPISANRPEEGGQ